ncbi:hypothetical protein PGH07_01710 [Sulfurovum sp. zt1-1]|uniref:4-fold beta flower domain-containing protein n=1 Tax=Sulfurovum zhangzhouensis TaxID=3019067 RepID=A0ABT7QVM4_9BACT|nr:hypothetical protein [Sulfurovum zhangzhouensis]MDM5270889.1 hypothetical protein [Sulfurovum zhangzhouensis]
MKTIFYNSEGIPYAYTEDTINIYTFEGTPVAYIDIDDIYAFSGAHLGFFEDGYFWDHNGDVLLFTDTTRFGCGPLKPKKSLKPVRALKTRKPLKGTKESKPLKPLKSRHWSMYSPEDLLKIYV